MPHPHIAFTKERFDRKGGLEKYTSRLIDAFCQRGCRVTLLTTGKPKMPSEVEVIDLGAPHPLSAVNIWQFNRRCTQWLQSHSYDCVFGADRTTRQTHYRAGNGVHAAFLDRRAGNEGGLKALSFKVNPLHRTILRYEKQAFESAGLRHLFVNSFMVRDEVLKYYRTNPQNISVVHNGVEWHEWQQPFDSWPEERPTLLRAFGLDPSCFQLLFVGHGFRRKGLHHLLHGLASLPVQDIQLSVVGRDKDAALFQSLADRLGLTQRVKFFGLRSDIISFYQAADALAIPSLYDPCANVTIEALAMGLFVLSSTDNGGSELLSSTEGHLIDDVGDQDSMHTALKVALNHPKNPVEASRIRLVARSYDFSQQLDTIIDRTLISGGFHAS